MAFRNKGSAILVEQPDILIIPECEHPDNLSNLNLNATSTLWYGTNRSKGLAVFSFGKYHLNLMDVHNKEIEIVCPISVVGGDVDFTLMAIWSQRTKDRNFRYIGQVWKAIHYYEKILSEKRFIIAGDFNSSAIWDKKHRLASHTMTVEKLNELQICSVYHSHHSQVHGKEIHPTFYMYRHENKPYHIDYCFVSAFFMERLKGVEIGDYRYWKIYSDHSPLIVNFSI
jgi:hypothetical protein